MTAEQVERIEYWYAAYRAAQTAELRRIARENLNALLGANMTDIIRALRLSLQPLT